MISIVIGPIIFGFIFGLVIGSRIHRTEKDSFEFSFSAIVALLIGSLLMSLNLGQFPVYSDFPIATAFISAIIGMVLSSLIFGNFAKGDS